ncbi:MAG: OmpP1/FadL family transporter [Hyphomicrobiales bacterium]
MMKKTYKSALAAGCAAIAATSIFTTQAYSAGFAVREQSAEFQGMSFAGAAAGGQGLSSMFFNPATITLHGGLMVEADGGLIFPYSEADDAGFAPNTPAPGLSNSDNICQNAFVPSTYLSYQLDEVFYVGLTINAPFGLVTEAGFYAGNPVANDSEVFDIAATAIVGAKLSDKLSVGVGAQVHYVDVELTSSLAPGSNRDQVRLQGDDWGVGFVVGVLYELSPSTHIGIGYRSKVDLELQGNLEVPGPNSPAEASLELPATATLSVRQVLTDRVTVTGTVEWAEWSSLKNLTALGPGGVVLIDQPFRWKDSWHFALGAEYQWSEALTVRAGGAYEISGVPDSTRSPRVPDNDRIWLSAGASYTVNNWLSVHAAYSHIFVEDGDVGLTPPDVPTPLFATFEQDVDIVSVSATVNLGILGAYLFR